MTIFPSEIIAIFAYQFTERFLNSEQSKNRYQLTRSLKVESIYLHFMQSEQNQGCCY